MAPFRRTLHKSLYSGFSSDVEFAKKILDGLVRDNPDISVLVSGLGALGGFSNECSPFEARRQFIDDYNSYPSLVSLEKRGLKFCHEVSADAKRFVESHLFYVDFKNDRRYFISWDIPRSRFRPSDFKKKSRT